MSRNPTLSYVLCSVPPLLNCNTKESMWDLLMKYLCPRDLRRGEMEEKMKNIAQSEVLTLREQISYQEGQIVSKTLTQNQAVRITLFSFAKGEEISTHESGGDAFVTCLDGIGKITIDGVEYLLHEGESIVMPAGHPHAVYGQEAFKMLLVVVF